MVKQKIYEYEATNSLNKSISKEDNKTIELKNKDNSKEKINQIENISSDSIDKYIAVDYENNNTKHNIQSKYNSLEDLNDSRYDDLFNDNLFD